MAACPAISTVCSQLLIGLYPAFHSTRVKHWRTIDSSKETSMSAVLSAVGDDYGQDRQVAQLRIHPHSIEAESSVLGGLLLDNAAWDRVSDLLTQSDFYRYEHRMVFGAVGLLINAAKPADVITVFEQLQSQGKAEEIGGLAY